MPATTPTARSSRCCSCRAARIAIVAAKAVSHWLVTGLPLVVAAPVFGLLFDMAPTSIGALVAGLVLGTPVMSLLGGLGAALTLGCAARPSC